MSDEARDQDEDPDHENVSDELMAEPKSAGKEPAELNMRIWAKR